MVGDVGSAREGQVIRIFFITACQLDWVNKGRVGQLFSESNSFPDWGRRVGSGSSLFWMFIESFSTTYGWQWWIII